MLVMGAPAAASFVPDLDHKRAFRDALGQFTTGVTLITVAGQSGPMGFIANSFSSLSIDPPLVMWSLARASRRFAHFATAAQFSIHVLGQDQADLLHRFSRDGAGFAGLDYSATAAGVPVLARALARFDCTLHANYDGGDHVILVGLVACVSTQMGVPLVFAKGQIATS